MIPGEVLRSFSGRSCLVTGGTGLIGRQVVRILADAEARVRVVSLDRLVVDERAEYREADLTDRAACREAARDAEFVFHLAGVPASVDSTVSKPASHFVPTLMLNTNLLEACREQGVRRLVYTSSIGAYAPAAVFREPGEFRGEFEEGPPMDFAGWAKRMGELQVHAYRLQYGLDWAMVRPANVYGPGDRFDPRGMVIPALMSRIHAGERPLRVWGDGSAVRDFVFSRDVAEGIILAMRHGTRGGWVNLGSGEGCSIAGLLEALRSFIDFSWEFDPAKPAGYPRRVMDISLARRTLGYEPATPLREGLKATWEWFLAHGGEHRAKQDYFTTCKE